MSTLRNSVHRRNHRERSQPIRRQNLGLLEKHKDYVLRARDYHKKQDTLKKLREKANFRNPDEFYFKMINTKTKDGVHIVDRGEALGADIMKLLRTQDLGYILQQRTIEHKKIEKLKFQLQSIVSDENEIGAIIDETLLNKASHTVFVDEEEEVETFDLVKHFDTKPELLSKKHNRVRNSELSKTSKKDVLTKQEKKEAASKRRRLNREIIERTKRLEKLDKAAREAEIQKGLLGKGKKQKIGKDEQGLPVYKFATERKR